MSSHESRPWIGIDDPNVSSADLVERVEARLRKRREEMGAVDRHFPSFDPAGSRLESGSAEGRMATLRYHLQRLEQSGSPDTTPLLAPSPATRLPVLGRLWQLVRREAHQLVLFYVNRALAHQARVNRDAVATLQEMVALLEAQDEEIRRLQARLDEAHDEEE